jgi:AcrR family transcriptional regulator
LKAAWAVFGGSGLDHATTADVARRAQVAKGTLFLYASDKDDLVCMMMHDRLANTMSNRLASLPRKKPLLDRVLYVFEGLFQLYLRAGAVGRRFVSTLLSGTGQHAQQINALTVAFLHRLAAIVVEAQARNEVSASLDPLLAAQAMFAQYFAVLVGWRQGFVQLRLAAQTHLRPSLELLMTGLLPRKSARNVL